MFVYHARMINIRKSVLFVTILIALQISASNVLAYQKSEISLESGTDLIYTRYEDNNSRLIIWLPSEYGASSEMIESALNIADEGFDLWTLDLHETYMEPVGRSSIARFSADDIYALMRIAKQKGYKYIVLSSANRGAVLALKAGRLWQEKHPNDHSFPGYIFISPHFIEGSVEIGSDARYLPISRSVNKPVYLLQPEYSTKFLRSDQIVKQLQVGGAPVKLHALKGITGGFHARLKEDLIPDDLLMRQQMGELYSDGFNFLVSSKQPTSPVSNQKQKSPTKKASRRMPSLYPYRGDPTAPALKLDGLFGKSFDLDDYRGKVVLINFWASWCGPCVKEIPSLNRLVKKLEGEDFALLTVDIKEPQEKILGFFKEHKIEHNFPVLMDIDGNASKQWKVYAYPSNYLLDKNGKIRYGYRGALEWDKEDVVKTIRSLL